jgi:hypothetical protein
VSAYSTEQYRKLTGHVCAPSGAAYRLKEIYLKGERVYPQYPAWKLLHSDFVESEYYHYAGYVVVWRTQAIVTVVQFANQDFYREGEKPRAPKEPYSPAAFARSATARTMREARRLTMIRDKEKWVRKVLWREVRKLINGHTLVDQLSQIMCAD